MVDVSIFDPVKDKFFTKHISSKTLGLFRKRINVEFQQAYAEFRDAESVFNDAFGALPVFAPGTTAAAEKAAAFDRMTEIHTRVRAPGQSHKEAIAACRQGTTDVLDLTRSLPAILEKATRGAPGEWAQTIALDKQMATADLNRLVVNFNAAAKKAFSRIRDAAPDAWATLPPVTDFQREVEILRGRIAGVAEKGQTLDAARKEIDALHAEAEKLYDTQLAKLAPYAQSDDFSEKVDDAAARTAVTAALERAREQAALLKSWEIPGGDALSSEVGPLAKRMAALFPKNPPDAAEARRLRAEALAIQKDLDALADKAARLIEARKTEFTKRQEAVKRRHATVNAAFLQIDNATLLPEQARLIRQQLDTANDAVADLNGFNTHALDAAMLLLEDCARNVLAAQKAAEANALIKDKLKTLHVAIDHGTAAFHPLAATLKQHLAEITDIEATWPTLPLPEAIARVNAFDARVRADLATDKEILQRRESARRALAAARAVQAEFDKKYAAFILARTGKKSKGYAGQPVADLDQAAQWIETRTVLSFYDTIDTMIARAQTQLREMTVNLDKNGQLPPSEIDSRIKDLTERREVVDMQIDAVGDGGRGTSLPAQRATLDKDIAGLKLGQELVDQAQKQAEDAERDQKARDQLKADSAAFDKAMRARIKSAKPGNPFHDHKAEIEGHLDRLAATRKAIKTIPLKQAQTELAFVRQIISDLSTRGGKTLPKDLGKIGKDWAEAVKTFHANADALVRAVEEFAKSGGPADAAPKLRTALDKIIQRLDAKAFDAVAKDFADPEKAKAAREAALRRVRVLQDIVRKDPVMQRCVANPFAVKGFATGLDYRLRQIELNVLRGV